MPATPRFEEPRRAPRGARWSLALFVFWVSFSSLGPLPSHAFNCREHPHSSCIDSNQQWLARGTGPFVALPTAEVRGAGSAVFTMAGVYQHRPLVLNAASPDGDGRDVPLVEHVVDAQALIEAGLGRDLDLGLALRLVPYQQGTGIDAARSRLAARLETTAVRDPLIGIGYQLFGQPHTGLVPRLKWRTELSLPLGDAMSFAGERGPVLAPGLVADAALGRFTVAAEVGARLRRSVTLGNLRFGNQLTTGLGLSLEAVRNTLFVALEAGAAPGLTGQPTPTSDRGRRPRLIPAEWALTVSAWLSKTCMLQLSGGTALPLSSERVDFGQGNSKLEHFAGLGAPEARVVTLLRVVTPDPGLSENSLLHEGHGHDDDRGATLGR